MTSGVTKPRYRPYVPRHKVIVYHDADYNGVDGGGECTRFEFRGDGRTGTKRTFTGFGDVVVEYQEEIERWPVEQQQSLFGGDA